MLDWRTVLLGVFVFAATYAGGLWFGVAKLPPVVGAWLTEFRASPAVAAANPTQQAATPQQAEAPQKAAAPHNVVPPQKVAALNQVAAPQQMAAPMPGRGLTADGRLAQAVILRAKAYLKPTCNSDPKTLYVMAATKYAEVLMRAAGCGQFPKCPIGESFLQDTWRRNRSPLDRQVAEAMASVHAAGGLTEKRFRGDVGRAVRVIAGRDFASGPEPSCQTSRSRRTVRIRRR